MIFVCWEHIFADGGMQKFFWLFGELDLFYENLGLVNVDGIFGKEGFCIRHNIIGVEGRLLVEVIF